MPITLFDTASQKPMTFETGSEAKDAVLSGQASFDPNQEVYLKDGAGAIVKAKGAEALGYILPPESPYSIASDEDVRLKNREMKYGTPAQQVVTGTEGLVNAAGLGFGNALTKTAIDLFTPRDSRVARWIQPVVLPNPCPGLLALRCNMTIWRGLRDNCGPSGRKPPACWRLVSIPHSTQNSAMFWLVGSPGWLRYMAVSKPIPPLPGAELP